MYGIRRMLGKQYRHFITFFSESCVCGLHRSIFVYRDIRSIERVSNLFNALDITNYNVFSGKF